MHLKDGENQYALIEISKNMDRFIVLPKVGDTDNIIMLDDLLRLFLNDIFTICLR